MNAFFFCPSAPRPVVARHRTSASAPSRSRSRSLLPLVLVEPGVEDEPLVGILPAKSSGWASFSHSAKSAFAAALAAVELRFGGRDSFGSASNRGAVLARGTVMTGAGFGMLPSIAARVRLLKNADIAISTYHYRGPSPYQGKRVLVAGCAISALEIAAELAQLGAARVVVTQRRQRYVLPKFAGGVPSDHRIFTRYGTLASETLPAAEIDRQLKEIVVEAGGSPEQYGAPAPDPSLFAAGITLSQHYLPLVAEGRITVRPWMKSIADATVTFADGHAEEFDGIVLGTGFDLCLPFLSEDIRAITNIDAVHLDADRYTFHPDLPGLAFMGMWDQSGGYFVPLELQARWIAYTWGGTIRPPCETDQRLSISAYRSKRGTSQKTRMNLVALTFARAAGVEPHAG